MKLKSLIAVAGVAVCATAWIGLAAGLLLGVERGVFTVLVVIAAFATEAMIWCLAVALGLTVFEARRKIWRAVTAPFRPNASS